MVHGDFGGEQRAGGQVPDKALAVKGADLDFRPVEPVRRRSPGRASFRVATRSSVRRRGPGRASFRVATSPPSAGLPAPTSPRPRARERARFEYRESMG